MAVYKHTILKNVPASLIYIIVTMLLLGGCSAAKQSNYNPSKKIPASELKEDFSILKKVLEANHPSLYWYTPKDSIDLYFNQSVNSITDSLTEIQFKNKIAWFVSKIRCGHTSARASETAGLYYALHRPPRFPLSIKTWGDSLVAMVSLNKADTMFKRGTVITSIENYSNRSLLDSMFQFISTDGYSDNFKSQAISFNFPLYYSFAFALKDSFLIHYIDAGGRAQHTYVHLNRPVQDTATGEKIPAEDKLHPPTHRQVKDARLAGKRSLVIDSSRKFAYMRLATFSGGSLRKFFRQGFRELNKKNVDNLAIDLRENSGGRINLGTILTRYLVDTAFHVADTVAAASRSFKYSQYIRPSFAYKLAMFFTTRKKEDGRYHFLQLERKAYTPYTGRRYKGQVYIIQGGYTFSAAAMFAQHLKGRKNITLVGEQTGGGNYGTSAVYLPDIVLPNSRVRVVLPLYRLVPDKTQKKDGQGIWPDVYVPPFSVDLKRGIDPKLQKIQELIQRQKPN